ncbi:RING finger protein 151-like [Ornithodoros turicata]|uniref:RING finger protein 151-like n=1 Tax=Ornithodoros turicata TaxID=34597 RepID=UPI0031386131
MCSAKCLSGFSSAMDWRPIEFMDLPSVRSCSLCNVVPKETFLLECSHALCGQCYQVVLRGNQRCPLDGESTQESEAQVCVFKPNHLQKCKMRCCNSSNGCDFVGNMEQVKNHFLSGCAFHVVSCNRCNAAVLRRDIVSHYGGQQCKSSSSSGREAGDNEGVVNIGRKIDASLDAIAERICAIETQLNNHTAGVEGAKQCTSANKQLLDQLLERLERTDGALRNAATNLLSREDLKGTLEVGSKTINEGTGQGRAGNAASGAQDNRGITSVATDEIIEKLNTIGRQLDTMEHIVKAGTNQAVWHIRGITELASKSKERGGLKHYSDVFVLCGYSVRMQLMFVGSGDETVHFSLQICQSAYDSFLKWPFCTSCDFTLLNPLNNGRKLFSSKGI